MMDKVNSSVTVVANTKTPALRKGQAQATPNKEKAPNEQDFHTLMEAGALAASANGVPTPATLPSLPKGAGEGSALAKPAAKAASSAKAGALENVELTAQPGAEAIRGVKTPMPNGVRSKAQKEGLSATSDERSPIAQKTAVSMNTGAAIAGLKPWGGKDWVFEGGQDSNPELKTLFNSAPAETPTAKGIASAMSAKAAAGEALSDSAPTQDMRGEAGLVSSPRERIASLLGGGTALQSDPMGDSPAAYPLDQSGETSSPRQLPRGFGHDRLPPGSESPRGVAAHGQSPLSAAQAPHHLVLESALEGYALPAQEPMTPSLGRRGLSAVGPGGAEGFGRSGALQRQGLGGASGLSGSEYLSALGAARGGRSFSGEEEPEDGMGQSGDSRFGREADFGSKPELRLIDGGLGGGLSGASAGGLAHAHTMHARPFGLAAPAVEVSGPVVKGAMSQDRLSSEALLGLSTGIRNLTPQGGGEIRVRLKPEALGELQVRVMAQGSHVGLEIQASDERAKKVLEESINHLKESLASQNLSLSKLDVTVAQSAGQSFAGDMRNDQGQPQSQNHAFNDWVGQNSNQGHGQSNHWGASDESGGSSTASGRPSAVRESAVSGFGGGTSSRSLSANGRLDVRA